MGSEDFQQVKSIAVTELAIVVPTCNERENLVILLEQLDPPLRAFVGK